MKINFKSADIQELNHVREYSDGYSVPDPGGMREFVSSFAYKGIEANNRHIQIPGVFIGILEGSRNQEMVYSIDSDFPYLQMHFEIDSSGCQYFPDAQREPVTKIMQGEHSLLFYSTLNGNLHYLPRQNTFSIEIELSLSFLQRVFNDDLGILRDFGNKVEKNHSAIMGNQSYPITAQMKAILFEIRDCEYNGPLKRIFLEAKVIELLVLQINQINSAHDTRQPNLKKEDIDKIHAIREMLLNDLYAHHSIEELSRIAGINRTKLQTGFKELFGATIFGYITDLRMEQARELIMQRRFNTIAEVSGLVGYKNPQHFTTAFKKKFGFLPSEL